MIGDYHKVRHVVPFDEVIKLLLMFLKVLGMTSV